MSGHSKWSTIKRAKEKTDQKRGKIFTKIGREIAVAVKLGGDDPSLNSKLYDAIAKAKANNMPNDTIQRSIKKASGEMTGSNYEEILYEGYGPCGSAIMVECLTDNKNRTAGDVRHLFDKYGAGLGTTNSVGYLFERKGVLTLEKNDSLNEEELFEMVLDAGASDLVSCDEVFEIYTEKDNFHTVKKALDEKGLSFVSANIAYVPNNLLELEEADYEKFETLIDALEDLDDVQNVYHNVD
ncbi:MAG: YebC/PmpR family DNA-binding transcriptional regulator [Clostridia bacterium]|nr:YebC/PmpR family DNA-binding transcriptional regulator [Clostridia bacterium]